jgi:gas vesicle protein
MTERRDFAFGILFGAMMGLAIGLLFAPQTGNETRARIRREGGRLRDDFVARARDAAGDAVSRGRSAFEEGTDRLRQAFETGRRPGEESTRFGEPEN